MPARCPNPKCDSTEFQEERCAVRDRDYQVDLITCLLCGTVVGLVPSDLIKRLDDIEKLIREIKYR